MLIDPIAKLLNERAKNEKERNEENSRERGRQKFFYPKTVK